VLFYRKLLVKIYVVLLENTCEVSVVLLEATGKEMLLEDTGKKSMLCYWRLLAKIVSGYCTIGEYLLSLCCAIGGYWKRNHVVLLEDTGKNLCCAIGGYLTKFCCATKGN
jgi:hypothetical protein